jgi:hypothetical protein
MFVKKKIPETHLRIRCKGQHPLNECADQIIPEAKFDFDCPASLWYNPSLVIPRMELETGMLLEDLKQELAVVRNRIETLRRHL